MSQYATIDALILICLLNDSKREGVEFHKFEYGNVGAEARRMEAAGCGYAFRVIDRRLQALRKRELIRHDSKIGWLIGWLPVEATA